MTKQRLSVVIPVRNDDGTVLDAIASALGQTLAPVEIIVVDDGSCPPLDLRIADPHVRCVRMATHVSAAAARNRGVEEALGDWVAFLDVDDLWEPDKLARQVGDRSPDDPVLLACNMMVQVEGWRNPYNRTPPATDLAEWLLVERQAMQTSGLVLPRRVALKFRFSETLRVYEDWDLVLRIAASGVPIAYIHDCLGTYRRLRPVVAPSQAALAQCAAWLSDPAAPAGIMPRYHHFLTSIFRLYLRAQPVAAVACLLGLAIRTGRPIRATLTALHVAWRLRDRRIRSVDGTEAIALLRPPAMI